MSGLASEEASLGHVLGRFAVVRSRVEQAVERRRAGGQALDDPFLGLYVSDEHVDRLLARSEPVLVPGDDVSVAHLDAVESAADAAVAAGARLRLRELADVWRLGPLDVEALLVAAAPDVDASLERLYGYLHDDVTRRRASVGLVLELCGRSAADGAARARFTRGAPLVAGDLLVIEDADRPLLSRSLRVPDRVVAHLLGDDGADPLLAGLLVDVVGTAGAAAIGDPGPLGRVLAEGVRLAYLHDAPGADATGFGVEALRRAGMPAVAVDARRFAIGADLAALAAVAVREARLAGGGLVVGPVEVLSANGPAAVRTLAESEVPVLLHGRSGWDPDWAAPAPLLVDVRPPTADERADLWRQSLDGSTPAGLDPAAETAHFRLGPREVVRAAEAAALRARLLGREVGSDDLRAGARAQNAGLERLARRIEPAVDWEDLVLPPAPLAALHELTARARHRELVLEQWRLRPGGGRGGGIAALFAGDSGTGKTLSAEVVAADLGLDLYVVDLATVVDKYVGETEKNLERIFSQADQVNGVLLFDEADALFGKRSEVRDAHDRYANIEVAFLLQRMEAFDGMAILATNLRANVDEAFARRLDVVVDFPVPDPEHRLRLWDRCLGAAVPRAPGLDLDFCAEAFELAGGNIRSIALTAAYLAADRDRPVDMDALVRATQTEYRKLGRLCVPSEFGPYYELLSVT